MSAPGSRASGAGGPARLELERADGTLLRLVDGAFHRAAARAGEHLACRPGCSECCIGPFPVTALDAWRLSRGMDALEGRDPARARAVRRRAREAVDRLTPGFPGNPATGALSADLAAQDAYYARHGQLPCPALDPPSGRCDLYPARPLSCRSYGPPARFGDEKTEPCRLCFTGASPADVERCRMEPDPGDNEGRLLALLGDPGVEPPETLIAFALARRGSGDGP